MPISAARLMITAETAVNLRLFQHSSLRDGALRNIDEDLRKDSIQTAHILEKFVLGSSNPKLKLNRRTTSRVSSTCGT